MERPYEIEFTDAFWRAVGELNLSRTDFTVKSLQLMENPYLGRDISGRGSNIRAWDITIASKGEFRWFYIVDDEISLIESVFIERNETPSRNRGEDAILMARLAEIAWRILTGG